MCNNPYEQAAEEELRPENASANLPERRGVGGVPAWERDASRREEVPLCRRADREGGTELFDPQQIQRIGIEEALGRMPVAAFGDEAPTGKLVFVNDSARLMIEGNLGRPMPSDLAEIEDFLDLCVSPPMDDPSNPNGSRWYAPSCRARRSETRSTFVPSPRVAASRSAAVPGRSSTRKDVCSLVYSSCAT